MSDPLPVLLPTDDSPSARAAARHVVALAARGLEVEVHLLSVQAPVRGAAASWLPDGERAAWHREEGMKALAGCEAILAAAGIRVHCHVGVGDPAEVAAAFAARLGCAQVVMGTRGLGAAAGLVMGSVATGIVTNCRLPVTLVHAG
jgi:nucleotide-binding universal stress UspA family protein